MFSWKWVRYTKPYTLFSVFLKNGGYLRWWNLINAHLCLYDIINIIYNISFSLKRIAYQREAIDKYITPIKVTWYYLFAVKVNSKTQQYLNAEIYMKLCNDFFYCNCVLFNATTMILKMKFNSNVALYRF